MEDVGGGGCGGGDGKGSSQRCYEEGAVAMCITRLTSSLLAQHLERWFHRSTSHYKSLSSNIKVNIPH